MATSISHRGYGVCKESLSNAELEELKARLTVQPFSNQAAPQKSFKLYTESSKKMYIPKSFGLAAYGLPEKNSLEEGCDIDINFAGSLRKEQLLPVDAYLKAAHDPERMGGIINLVCGQGKCLSRGTLVMMSDGTRVPVEDVKVGDRLMGDDSLPRLVASTCQGAEVMYRITSKGTTYTVNASHILSLIDAASGELADMSVLDYLDLPAEKRERLRGYRVPVEFVAKDAPLHSYAHGFDFGTQLAGFDGAAILPELMMSPRTTRLALLRGVYDACGIRNDTNDTMTFPYNNDLEYVLRSLGFMLTLQPLKLVISATAFDRMTLAGWIPCAFDLAYKIEVQKLDVGDYYGFEIQGANRRFLLGDCTVTHNTVCALYIITMLKKKALIVVHKDFLLNQWKERIDQFIPSARVGMIKGKTCDTTDKDIVIGSLQSLSMKEYERDVFGDFGMLVVDECLPYHQRVVTEHGPTCIGDLVQLWMVGSPTPRVMAYNDRKHTFVWSSVTHAWERVRTQPLVRLRFRGVPDIVCTEGHKLLTARGYVFARDVEVDDTLVVTWGQSRDFPGAASVLDKLEERGSSHVYDLEVEQYHNFVCTDAEGNAGVVVHNCHRTGAEVFSRVYRKINTRYSLGLSATVNRKDGLTKVFKWHIGDIVFKGSKRKDTVQVRLVDFQHCAPEYSKEWLMYTGKPNTSKMINNICDFAPRTEFVVELIAAILKKEPARKLLILSDRRKHLETFKTLLDARGIENGFYYGGMKPLELKESESKQVLLATFAFCAEGLDVASLDTLVLASPKSDIIQSVGRILREKEQNRLHVPLVVDIIDKFSMFPAQAKKRLKYYKGQGYAIQGGAGAGGEGDDRKVAVKLTSHAFVEE